MNIFNRLSVKLKIYMIAIVSLLGFGAYLGFNVWVNSNNAKLLNQLRESYFPVLEKSTQNHVNLERLAELLNNAAMTAESEYIEKAEKLAQKMDRLFDEVIVLEPDRKKDVENIKEDFNAYFVEAKLITEDLLGGEVDRQKLAVRAVSKEEKLVQVRKDMVQFIEYAHAKFSGSIDAANMNSKYMLTSGFAIWGVCILILGVSCYIIARVILGSINKVSESLEELAHGSDDFSRKITVASYDEIGKLAESFNALLENLRIKTNDLMSMMQNMHTGLFTIMEDESIHREYSAYIEQIFECAHVTGKNYADFLFARANVGADVRNQVCTAVSSLLGEDEMMFEFNSHLLINEFTLLMTDDTNNKRTKILEVDWDPIITDGMIRKIMVSIRDVTELRAMQAAAEEQKMELEIVGQILKLTPQRFRAFAENAFALIDRNRKIISNNTQKNPNIVAELFANMHTIKGNARTYQLSYITDIVHEVEFTYDRMRKEDAYPWVQTQLTKELENVREALGSYMNIFKEKLAFATENISLPADSLVISRSHIQILINQIEPLLVEKSNVVNLTPIMEGLRRMDAKPLPQVLDGLLATLPDVARQLQKTPPRIRFEGGVAHIFNSHTDTINNVFSHVLKNAIDHGIETPDERRVKGKHEQGTITIETASNNQNKNTTIMIYDDGKGLNIRALRAKLLEDGVMDVDKVTPQQVADGMFMSGISTAEKLTDISGRGVGMDAVKRCLNALDGDISIEIDKSASFENAFVPFRLIITLGEKVCVSTVVQAPVVALPAKSESVME